MRDWCDFNTAQSQTFAAKESSLSADEIRERLLGRLEAVLTYLLPAGRIEGGTFKVGDVQGNTGDSLKVELNSGKPGIWHDFATDEGGDIFDLWAACHHLDVKTQFPDVIDSINTWLGCANTLPTTPVATPKHKSSPPNDLGHHSAKWDYFDADGHLIACVYRYDTEDGKVYRPWDATLRKHKAPIPRPLYNQPGLLKDTHVVLVEGEKCAEALIKLGITATTAMNGANAPVDKTNWSPLQNKHVLIWPDNDKAGYAYAKKVNQYLIEKNIAASVKMLSVPDDKPDKWDAVDAVSQGCDIHALLQNHCIIQQDVYEEIMPCDWQGEPPKREWLIEDWLPRGYVTALYGDGGMGKSLLAQQLMTCLATGKPWLGLETKALRVYGVMCEDDRNELWRRQCRINNALKVTMCDLKNSCFVSRVGSNNLIMTFDGKDSGKLTHFFDTLLKHVMNFSPDLVVLDTAADLFGGNEINRTQVRQFVQNACGKIARNVNAAVLLCAHPSDSGIQRKTGTGGSTAWNNTVRSRWYLTRSTEVDADPNERILSRKKSNYAAQGSDLHLLWHHGAFIQFTPDSKTKCVVGNGLAVKRDAERDRKEEVILGLIASEALEGRVYSATTFAQKFEAAPYRLGSESTIKRHLERYATRGLIKFNQQPENYGLSKPAVSQGYLCVDGMQFATGKEYVNPETGKIEPEFASFYPTHFKSEQDSFFHRVEDPTVWVQKKSDITR